LRNNFSEYLLAPTGFELRGQTARVPIRLPWYRALPLSVFELGSLRIDGVEVQPADIQLIVNGRAHPVTALGELVSDWWYVLDDATLEARLPVPPPAGARSSNSDHLVELTLKLFPPYIPGLAWVTQAQRHYRAA
jgi:hypothetical protein